MGKGKLDELKAAYKEAGAEVLLVDDELTRRSSGTLENALDARVIDRTQLILDIFAQHAVTAEGKLQVELAQLEYNLPRMRGMWKHPSASAAARARWARASARAAPASRSSRATAAWRGGGSLSSSGGSRPSSASARRAGSSARSRRRRSSRLRGTRTSASRPS